MIELKITEVNGYHYYLTDKKNNNYAFNIEFYGLDHNPIKNDYIYINEKYLKKLDTILLSYGPLEDNYGKKISNVEDEEVICLKKNNQLIYLKRYYG